MNRRFFEYLLPVLLMVTGCKPGGGFPAFGSKDPSNQLRRLTAQVKNVRKQLEQAHQAAARDVQTFVAAVTQEQKKGMTPAARVRLGKQLAQLQTTAEGRFTQAVAKLDKMRAAADKIEIDPAPFRPAPKATGGRTAPAAKPPALQAREDLLRELAAARAEAAAGLGEVRRRLAELRERLGFPQDDGKPGKEGESAHSFMSTF